MSELVDLVKCLYRYNVQTFFSFQTGEDTTFKKLAINGVDKYIELSQELEDKTFSTFISPCFPNFTVLPEDKSKVVYGSKTKRDNAGNVILSDEREEQYKLWMYGVYVSAAFVAAGMAAAWQCPGYLADKLGRSVPKNMPGVRFDIEMCAPEGKDSYSSKLRTSFGKEIIGLPSAEIEKVNINNFGFMFSSDLAGNITVFKARNMGIMPSDTGDTYTSIYRQTTKTFLARELKKVSENKRDLLESQYKPGGQIKWWETDRGVNPNSLLWSGDSIEPIQVENKIATIDVNFGGNAESIEILIR